MSGSEGVVASGVSRLGPKEELILRQWFEPRARPVTSPQSDEPALSGFDGTSASFHRLWRFQVRLGPARTWSYGGRPKVHGRLVCGTVYCRSV